MARRHVRIDPHNRLDISAAPGHPQQIFVLDAGRRFSYMLSAGDRLCAFALSCGHNPLRADRTQLQFRLGSGVDFGPGRRNVVTLTGEWRFHGATAISFRTQAGLGKQPALRF